MPKFKHAREHTRNATVEPEARTERMDSTQRRAVRAQLYAVNPRCCWCRTRLALECATIEHVRPLSKGGTNALSNLRLACEVCNNDRGSKNRKLNLT